MMRRGGSIYYAIAPSKLYAEPKRLEKLGYVKSKKAAGKTRERTFYTLTSKGLAALKRWAFEPSPLPRIQNEAIARLICGDIVADDAKLLEGLRALGPAIEDQEARLDEARSGSSHSPTASGTSCSRSRSARSSSRLRASGSRRSSASWARATNAPVPLGHVAVPRNRVVRRGHGWRRALTNRYAA